MYNNIIIIEYIEAKNNKRPTILPCGTPETTGNKSE